MPPRYAIRHAEHAESLRGARTWNCVAPGSASASVSEAPDGRALRRFFAEIPTPPRNPVIEGVGGREIGT
eukprot:5502914-Alexandrium_andersonii.AAC.1